MGLPQSSVKRKPSSIFGAFIDLVLYSNVWIALCATAMCWQTQLLLSGQFFLVPLGAFIFSSTLLLYAIHRLVGLSKAEGFKEKGRYFVIERFRTHIGFYAVLSGLAAIWFAWQLPWKIWLWMIPGILLSVAYVLPVFGKRLRDYHFIKIFLIAFSWAWITVLIPGIELGWQFNLPAGLLFFERAFFIFAITLPFDIRDLEIDQVNGVKTLPAILGLAKTKRLGISLLLLAALFGWMAFQLDAYPTGAFLGLLLSLLISGIAIWRSDLQKHDYFYSGLMDGLMLVQFVCVWIGYDLA